MLIWISMSTDSNKIFYKQQQICDFHWLITVLPCTQSSLIDHNPCVIKHRLHMTVDWPCQQTDSITWLSSALKTTTYCESSEAWSPSSQETWLWVHCCDSVLRLPPSCDCSMKKLCKVQWRHDSALFKWTLRLRIFGLVTPVFTTTTNLCQHGFCETLTRTVLRHYKCFYVSFIMSFKYFLPI